MSHERQPLLARAPEENNTDAGRACVQVTKIGKKSVQRQGDTQMTEHLQKGQCGGGKRGGGEISKDQTIFTTSLLFKVQNENEVSA